MKRFEAFMAKLQKKTWYWPTCAVFSVLLSYVTVSAAIDNGSMLQWALSFFWLGYGGYAIVQFVQLRLRRKGSSKKIAQS